MGSRPFQPAVYTVFDEESDFQVKNIVKRIIVSLQTSKLHVISDQGGANDEYQGGPGGGFSGNRRSGKPLRLLRLKNHPRDYKNQYQVHQDHPGTR